MPARKAHLLLFLMLLLGIPPAFSSWEFPLEVSALEPTREWECSVRKWHHDRIKENGRAIVDPICAALRDDGKERLYALLQGGPVVEMELRADGPRTAMVMLNEATTRNSPIGLAIVHVKGRRRPSLFVHSLRWVSEFYWDGAKWAVDSFELRNLGLLRGFQAAALRGDGWRQLYAAYDGGTIMEYTRTPIGWGREKISTGLGHTGRMALVRVPGSPRHELMIETMEVGKRRYLMRWREESRVAVVPFSARGLPVEEASVVADMIRVRLVQRGHCKVLEREQIDVVFKEQSFQNNTVIDPKSAVRLGRLLNAEKVVLGSVGILNEKRFATVSIVTVETGAIKNAEYVDWSAPAELERGVELLAQASCPDMSLHR